MKIVTLVFAAFLVARSASASEITEAEVRAFLDHWLKTQNGGSFSSYASMYATQFYGIKRSGNRTYRYNHDTWLKDRKKMFNKKMMVSADNLQIHTADGAATLRYEQTWQSGRYKDKGTKQVYLIREGERLRIAREEMLASKIMQTNNGAVDADNFPFAFSIKEGIVLNGINDIQNLTRETPRLTATRPYYVASAAVETDLLPQNIKALTGMKVRLYGPRGSCNTVINGFKIVSKDIPHFGYVQQWKDEKTAEVEIVRRIFTEGNLHLVATTETCSGDFATDARLPELPIGISQPLSDEMKRRVWDAFRGLAAYRREIKPYEKNLSEADFHQFSLPLNGKTSTWVSIFVVAGQPYCSTEGGGILGALWEVVGEGKKQTLRWRKYFDDPIDYATDINADGVPDFHFKESVGRDDSSYFGFIGGKKTNGDDIKLNEAAYNDCPC